MNLNRSSFRAIQSNSLPFVRAINHVLGQRKDFNSSNSITRNKIFAPKTARIFVTLKMKGRLRAIVSADEYEVQRIWGELV
jgi:hypothetical protein